MARVHRRRWRDKRGKLHVSTKHTITFRDHHSLERSVTAGTDGGAAKDVGRNFDKLVSFRAARLRPDPELTRWLETLPAALVDRLKTWDILSGDVAGAGKPLAAHLDDFKRALESRGGTAAHATKTYARVKAVVDGCGFKWWSDIEASSVMAYLAELRHEGTIGKETSNYYLAAVKQFAAWMVLERRASENPVKHLQRINARADRRVVRRALSADECRALLAHTETSTTTIGGMVGRDRAMLYRVALESGLRWAELRSLTRGSFTLNGVKPTVTVSAAYSKHRREDTLPLRPETAEVLTAYLGNRLATARAFPMPASRQGAKMLKADMESASLSTDRIDFHALRHTFISALCNGGVHPKVAQSLARHSTITLTMDRYTHLAVASQRTALDALPDLDAHDDSATRRATGTCDATADRQLTGKLTVGPSESGRFGPLPSACGGGDSDKHDAHGTLEAEGESCIRKASETGAPGRIRTPDRGIRNPVLYPAELLARSMRWMFGPPLYAGWSIRQTQAGATGCALLPKNSS